MRIKDIIVEYKSEDTQSFEREARRFGFTRARGGSTGNEVYLQGPGGYHIGYRLHPTSAKVLNWALYRGDDKIARGYTKDELIPALKKIHNVPSSRGSGSFKDQYARQKAANESASGGSTAAGSIASVSNPLASGSVSKRPSLFGYVKTNSNPTKKKKTTKKSKKKK